MPAILKHSEYYNMSKSEFITAYVIARASSATYTHPDDVLSDAEVFWDKISKEQSIQHQARLGAFMESRGIPTT